MRPFVARPAGPLFRPISMTVLIPWSLAPVLRGSCRMSSISATIRSPFAPTCVSRWPGAGRQDADAEYTQELASDYMRMACTQAKKTELPEPYQLETINKRILVMGGGIAGLTAAREAAKAGYQVTLVEKAEALGGKALGWRKQFPSKAPWTDLGRVLHCRDGQRGHRRWQYHR